MNPDILGAPPDFFTQKSLPTLSSLLSDSECYFRFGRSIVQAADVPKHFCMDIPVMLIGDCLVQIHRPARHAEGSTFTYLGYRVAGLHNEECEVDVEVLKLVPGFKY